MRDTIAEQLRALKASLDRSFAALASDPVLACAHGRVAHDHHEDDPVVEDLERRVAGSRL